MRLDAFVSMLIYTLGTISFYVLGAAVLHRTARNVPDNELIGRLADMYRQTLGEWSHALFLVGALVVLYSTFFVATASNARLLVDIGGLLGVRAAAAARPKNGARPCRSACVLLPLASATAFVVGRQSRHPRADRGGRAGTDAAPAGRRRRLLPPSPPAARTWPRRTLWTVALWTSALLIAFVGAYQLLRTIGLA